MHMYQLLITTFSYSNLHHIATRSRRQHITTLSSRCLQLFVIKVLFVWQNSDFLNPSRRPHIGRAILRRHHPVIAPYPVSSRRDVMHVKHDRPPAKIGIISQSVDIIPIVDATAPFPWSKRLLSAKSIGQENMVRKNLNGVAPWDGDCPRKPSVVAYGLLHDPLRIESYGFE